MIHEVLEIYEIKIKEEAKHIKGKKRKQKFSLEIKLKFGHV